MEKVYSVEFSEWRPYIEHLQRLGPGWPFEALERLLILTARYGYGGPWSTNLDERAEQEERLALHNWARAMLREKEKPTSTDFENHIIRLCDCLTEAVAFAQEVRPGTGHNAGLWAAAITEARGALYELRKGGNDGYNQGRS